MGRELTPNGRRADAISVMNGLFGDTLEARGSRLALDMTIRAGDRELPLGPDLRPGSLDLPGARPRICVLVHGLMSNESIWRFPDDPTTTYGTMLARDHDVTAVSVRYNTGRHISTNGRELAAMLQRLIRAWPVRVREIDLVGHSMGGLVVRSACHYGRHVRPTGRRLPFGRRWTSRVRRVVLIGVPNAGAPLEVFVNSFSAALWSVPIPIIRMVGAGLDRRSAGIKDLRFGAIVDEDWLERDPGDRAAPERRPVQPLRRARYLTIAGTLTADAEHPIARRIGDALVTPASAIGRSDPEPGLFPEATARLFPNVNHVAIAHHPDVYVAIDSWW